MTNMEALAYCLKNPLDEISLYHFTCSIDCYDRVGTPHWVEWKNSKIKMECDSEFLPFSKHGEPYSKHWSGDKQEGV